MTAPDLLERLEGVREGYRGWMANCPAHEDRSPSLSITPGDDGRVLLHCFAGCSNADVLAAAGLEWSALFADGPRPSNGSARPVPRPGRRKPSKPQPVDTILAALNVAEIEWRATPSPDMWVISECPRCLAADVWLYFRWTPHWSEVDPRGARLSCPDGCSRGDILAALEDSAYIAECGR